MRSCREIEGSVRALAALPPEALPADVRDHLAGCRGCAGILARARLARGLLAAAAAGPEPPEGFAGRILAALPAGAGPQRGDGDLWRPAWGLVPAFAATAVLLLILFQATGAPRPLGLFPAEGLSAGERLVLGARPLDANAVLAAVMEDGGR